MHGPEFYANKRHKGNSYHDGHNNDREHSSSLCQPTTPKTPHSVSTIKSELDHSPAGAISSPDDHNNSNGSGDQRGPNHGSGMMVSNVSSFVECNQEGNLGNKARDSTEKKGEAETGDLFFITYLYMCMVYGMALLVVCNMYIYGCRL